MAIESEADAVVIGAGIVGCATAYNLARRAVADEIRKNGA